MTETEAVITTAQPRSNDPNLSGEVGVRVIRGGSLRVAATLTGVLAGALSAPLVVRHLGVVDYGRYLTVGSVIFVVTALTEGGLTNVAVRAFSVAGAEERRALIANLTGLRLALGALGSAGAIGFGLAAGYGRVVILGLVLGAGGYVAAGVQGAYAVALSGRLRLRELAGIELVRSLLTTIFLITLVLAGSGLAGFFAVAVVVQSVALAITGLLVRREVRLLPAFDLARWRALLHETALYAVATALGAAYFQVALVSMSLLDPGKQTGYYAISFRVVEILNGVPWLLAGSVLPVLAVAATDRDRFRFIARRVFEGALLAGGWFSIMIVLGAKFAIEVIAGAQGAPAVGVMQVMGIGAAATFLVSSWGFALLAQRSHRALLIANAAVFALAVLLSLTLIPAFHAEGGAATTATLEIALATAYVAILWRHHIRPPGRFLLCFVPALALAFGIGELLLAVHPVLAVAVASAVYFSVLWSARAIPPELLSALPWRR